MINKLQEKLHTYCDNWDKWLNSFDEFVKHTPRDPDDKMFLYRHSPDYCIWFLEDDHLYTISYKYVHCIGPNGDMYCLQKYSSDKEFTLLDYKKLCSHLTDKSLPIFKRYMIDSGFLYTEFVNPDNTLGYPPAYCLLNIMMNSNTVIADFRKFMTRAIDKYVIVMQACKELSLPYYEPHHVIVNNFVESDNFYFKDSMFFYSSKLLSIDKIADKWYSSIDGFRRAQGIISAYSNREDSDPLVTQQIFEEIERLATYARDQCLSLKN